MAPLMTSRSGSTAMNINARPTTWNVSMTKTSIKCEDRGFFHDLKTHIRMLRKSVPISGTANVITMHQNQAIRSSSGNVTTNCLSRPEREKMGFYVQPWDFSRHVYKLSNSIVVVTLDWRILRLCIGAYQMGRAIVVYVSFRVEYIEEE